MIFTMIYDSPVGNITLAAKGEALTGLWIDGQKHYLSTLNEEIKTDSSYDILKAATNWLDRYFASEKPSPDSLSLAPSGSNFAMRVWQFLLEIPYGETTTYGEIAGKIARERGVPIISAQAVGVAVGHNPISIIIPCHRVIGKNGNLTGYAGGIDKKFLLLKHEGIELTAKK